MKPYSLQIVEKRHIDEKTSVIIYDDALVRFKDESYVWHLEAEYWRDNDTYHINFLLYNMDGDYIDDVDAEDYLSSKDYQKVIEQIKEFVKQ